jgi:hypothetical protein
MRETQDGPCGSPPKIRPVPNSIFAFLATLCVHLLSDPGWGQTLIVGDLATELRQPPRLGTDPPFPLYRGIGVVQL